MNKFLQFAFGFITLLFFSGCISQHQQLVKFPDQSKPIEDPEKGRIYVMRKPWPLNYATHVALVAVRDGDLEVGAIAGHRGFLCWEREPGQTRISCNGGGIGGLMVTVEKGKVYYILQCFGPVITIDTVLSPAHSVDISPSLQLVNEVKGRQELSKCKPPTNSQRSP